MKKKRTMAFVMAVFYFVTVLMPVQNIYAEENQETVISSLDKAVEWLVSAQKQDGSWGSGNAKLASYESIKALQEQTKGQAVSACQKGIQWAKQQKEINADYLARRLSISELHQSEERDQLLKLQNADGGFGISAGFGSDILDTSLAIEAVLQAEEYQKEAVESAILYLLNKQKEDGSLAYETNSDSSVLLTAQGILVMKQFMAKSNAGATLLQQQTTKAAEYLAVEQQKTQIQNTSVSEKITWIQSYRALLKTKGVKYTSEWEAQLYQMPLENGSIENDSYATALYIQALQEKGDLKPEATATPRVTATPGITATPGAITVPPVTATPEATKEPEGSITSMKLYCVKGDIEEETDLFEANDVLKYKIEGNFGERTEIVAYITNEKNEVVYLNYNAEGIWEIKDSSSGMYTLHGQIINAYDRTVLAEKEKTFQIKQTLTINNLEAFLSTDTAVVGEGLDTTVKSELSYKSNQDVTLLFKTKVIKEGEAIEEKEQSVTLPKTKKEYQTDLLTFTPDTTEEGSYEVLVQLYDNEWLLKETKTSFTVAAAPSKTKISLQQNMNKSVVYPGNDEVFVNFKLQGMEQSIPQNVPNQMLRAMTTANVQATGAEQETEETEFWYKEKEERIGALLYNKYIEIATSNNNFSIGTKEGDPNKSTDDNKKLTYGHPSGRSCYVSLKVDNNILGCYLSEEDDMIPNLDKGSLSSKKVWENNIEMDQILTIVENNITGRKDIIEIKYLISNKDNVKHDVGVKILMDTMLGDYDNAPFKVPGIGTLVFEKELQGDSIPPYFQVFDNLYNPSIIAQGVLYKDIQKRPDKVQFLNWTKAITNTWEAPISTGEIGDSAINIFWDPISLKPGEIREYVTYYGVGELDQNTEGNLAAGVTGPTQLEKTETGYQPNPLFVTAYAKNGGVTSMEQVQGKIVLPEGLILAQGETATKEFGTLARTAEAQVSWNVVAKPSAVDKNLVYSVVFSVNGQEIKTVNRTLFVPKLIDNIAGKDIVLETTVQSSPLEIDQTACNPEPIEIIENEDGSKRILWKLESLLIDESKDFILALKGEELPAGETALVTKNTKLHYTNRDGEEKTQRLENLTIPINQYAIKSTLTTEEETYKSKEAVIITEQTKNLRDFVTTLHGVLAVYNEEGELVETIDDTLKQTWVGEEEEEMDYTWNTALYPTGKYSIKMKWMKGKQVVARSETNCIILADGSVTNQLNLDKAEYNAREKVTITDLIKNTSTNHIETDLEWKVQIVDANGQEVYQTTESIGEFPSKDSQEKMHYFNTASLKAGEYKVISSVCKEGVMLHSSKKAFTLLSTKKTLTGIKGTIKVSKKEISPGESLDITTHLTNLANESIEDLPTAIRIIKAEEKTEVKRFEQKATLEAGGTAQSTTTWEQASIEEGKYIVIYEGITENDTIIPLGTDTFQVSYIRDDFENDNDIWNYMGSAYRSPNGYAVLTENKNNQRGAMWLKKGINKPFVTTFKYKNGGGNGADGFVFMFGKKPNELGNEGRELAFKEGNGYGVEFDSFYNLYHGEHCDIQTKHIAFIKDSLSTAKQGEVLKPLAVNLEKKFADKIGDNQWHDVEIRVNYDCLEVFVDGDRAVYYKGKISFDFDGFGFAAATGTQNDNHFIDQVVIRENTTIAPEKIADDFSKDTGKWTYMGSAHYAEEGYAVLTHNKDWQAGAMWLNNVMTAPYNAKFKYRAGGGSGADGFVFMFGKNPRELGDNGGALGFKPGSGYGLEFDSFCNENQGEHAANKGKHIALGKNKISSSQYGEVIPHLAISTDKNIISKVNDDNWHDVEVQVRKDGVTVYLDGTKVLTWNGSIDKNYSGLGFAAGTGSITQHHYIDDVQIEENIDAVVETVQDNFDTNSGIWNYMGSASYQSNGYARLTEKSDWQAGAMWLKTETSNCFQTDFRYKIDQGSGPADGFTYMFYKKGNELGDSGQSLGFADNSGYAIEFDTYYNSASDEKIDKAKAHIALVKNSTKGSASAVLAYNNDEKVIAKLLDNQWHSVRVEVEDDIVFVFLDGEKIIEWRGEFNTTYRATGFSAGTGGINQSHMIDDFKCRIER